MIKKISCLEQIPEDPDTAFGIRIRSTAEAYGVDTPFAQFWKQDSGAILCKLDDAAVLAAPPDADFEELRELARMAGAVRMLCRRDYAGAIALPVAVEGEIMRRARTDSPCGAYEENPSPRDLHALLLSCDGEHFHAPEFEPFYLDLSHRTRHAGAVSVGIRRDGALAACAICTAKTRRSAFISAVAVSPFFRRQGLGREAVQALFHVLTQKTVFLLRAQNENEAFYRSLRFEAHDKFAELSLEGQEFCFH